MVLRSTLVVVLVLVILGMSSIARGGTGDSLESLNPKPARPVRESRLIVSCRAVPFKSRAPALREETPKLTAHKGWGSLRRSLGGMQVNVRVTIPLGWIANRRSLRDYTYSVRVRPVQNSWSRHPPFSKRD